MMLLEDWLCLYQIRILGSAFGGIQAVVNRITSPPQYFHTLIPRTCEYLTLHGKRAFVGVIKLRALKWGHYPVL